MLLGASGHTGQMVAAELVRRGQRPVLAGRSPERLATLAEALGGLSWRQADVTVASSVQELGRAYDVLISTVGPFARLGEPVVAAAIDAGATYLDSSGEPAFIRRVFEDHGPQALASGVALLPACGYDFVPGALAAAIALEQAKGAATRVDVGYFVVAGSEPMRMSNGTRNSGPGFMLGKSFAWRDGGLRAARFAERERAFAVDGYESRAVSVGGSEHLTLPTTFPQLREVNVYLGWFGSLSPALRAGSAALAPLLALPGTRAALTRLGEAAAHRTSRGKVAAPKKPSSEVNEPQTDGASRIVAIAHADDGRQVGRADLRGIEPYAFTAAFLAWAGVCALDRQVAGAGALGPLQAFGRAGLQAGCEQAGIRIA